MKPDRAVRLIAALEKVPAHIQEKAIAFLENSDQADTSLLSEPEPFLTLRELAEKLNFHPSTLWRWQVPCHELAGRPRFKASEVLAYLSSDDFRNRARQLRQHRRAAQ
ncbi:MAG TPA: helix-turn-helix domain-containing protein [Kiritimatiellia bacterium]|nr:helix-turn-helix domain-containing protein [Kiritimatiellia bacterium]HMP35041.1 helix-turn-helix domain-containing protein [Kiritimatiellia bacterium]